MEKTLVDDFNTFVPIYEYDGKLWARISGQIYLELRDFEWLGGVFKTLLERVRAGESLRGKTTSAAGNGDVSINFEKVTLTETPQRKATGTTVKRFDVTQGGWVES
jgi:hypothetical protein